MPDVNIYQVIGELFVANLQHQQDKAAMGTQVAEIRRQLDELTAKPIEEVIAAAGGVAAGPLEQPPEVATP